ncbi:DUF3325 domain-containing protein [Pelomonas sp. CA6]|uniref:DUF3325 family protein n=1 Tax=Pelomonas sp. CA6 TaxID=2907999 RepID=UPI001F4C2C02|nr:DUF3325 family protein [Pelomonas sp. CA6]MCH7343805.1 DUF3325 domain-containing protein [Pelomonas sp. CA6]
MGETGGIALAMASVLALLGMGWLALAMEVHWAQVHGREGPPAGSAPRLRWLGAGALLGALALCLRADHASMAALVWVMLLAAAALGVALTLAWRPAALRWLWPARR